jgi:hypothetical protein
LLLRLGAISILTPFSLDLHLPHGAGTRGGKRELRPHPGAAIRLPIGEVIL